MDNQTDVGGLFQSFAKLVIVGINPGGQCDVAAEKQRQKNTDMPAKLDRLAFACGRPTFHFNSNGNVSEETWPASEAVLTTSRPSRATKQLDLRGERKIAVRQPNLHLARSFTGRAGDDQE